MCSFLGPLSVFLYFHDSCIALSNSTLSPSCSALLSCTVITPPHSAYFYLHFLPGFVVDAGPESTTPVSSWLRKESSCTNSAPETRSSCLGSWFYLLYLAFPYLLHYCWYTDVFYVSLKQVSCNCTNSALFKFTTLCVGLHVSRFVTALELPIPSVRQHALKPSLVFQLTRFISRSLFHVSKNYFLNKVSAGNNLTFYSEMLFIESFSGE